MTAPSHSPGQAGQPSQLSAHHLQKSFGKKQVVHDVSIHVRSGEAVGLLGPNGAGKTTSFYMMVGLVAADDGKIELDGKDLTDVPMYQRAQRGLGYLPQEPSIFRKLTVEENLLAILESRPELERHQQLSEAQNLMDEFHLSDLRDSLGMSLSGGERRRVEIARALAANPRFILLDEPFAGVDPISVSDIQLVIRYLSTHRNIGIIVTDHNVRETLKVCQRAYIISEGTVIAEGAPDQILENPKVREAYLGHEFEM